MIIANTLTAFVALKRLTLENIICVSNFVFILPVAFLTLEQNSSSGRLILLGTNLLASTLQYASQASIVSAKHHRYHDHLHDFGDDACLLRRRLRLAFQELSAWAIFSAITLHSTFYMRFI